MPTGVAVSKQNRMFVNFPRWGDPVEFTVAEVRTARSVPFPNRTMNKLNDGKPATTLVSVQSVVVDEQDRLWILDTGSINFGPPKPGGPKLVAYRPEDEQGRQDDHVPAGRRAADDVPQRRPLRPQARQEGMAFITDSSDTGPNGIIVVDLASRRSWRRLNDHPSTKAEPNFAPVVEGEPLMARPPSEPRGVRQDRLRRHRDHAGREDALLLPAGGPPPVQRERRRAGRSRTANDQVAATVKDLGDRGFASDGLECDQRRPAVPDRLRAQRRSAARRRRAERDSSSSDPRMIWPDTHGVRAATASLYFTANQLNRQKQFHHGKDLRKQPYVVFRVFPDGGGARRRRWRDGKSRTRMRATAVITEVPEGARTPNDSRSVIPA